MSRLLLMLCLLAGPFTWATAAAGSLPDTTTASAVPNDLVSSLLLLLQGIDTPTLDLSISDGTFAAEEAAYIEAVTEFDADAYKFTQEMSQIAATAAAVAASTATDSSATGAIPSVVQILAGTSQTTQWAVDLSDFVVPSTQVVPTAAGLSRRSLLDASDPVPDIWIPGIYRSKTDPITGQKIISVGPFGSVFSRTESASGQDSVDKVFGGLTTTVAKSGDKTDVTVGPAGTVYKGTTSTNGRNTTSVGLGGSVYKGSTTSEGRSVVSVGPAGSVFNGITTKDGKSEETVGPAGVVYTGTANSATGSSTSRVAAGSVNVVVPANSDPHTDTSANSRLSIASGITKSVEVPVSNGYTTDTQPSSSPIPVTRKLDRTSNSDGIFLPAATATHTDATAAATAAHTIATPTHTNATASATASHINATAMPRHAGATSMPGTWLTTLTAALHSAFGSAAKTATAIRVPGNLFKSQTQTGGRRSLLGITGSNNGTVPLGLSDMYRNATDVQHVNVTRADMSAMAALAKALAATIDSIVVDVKSINLKN